MVSSEDRSEIAIFDLETTVPTRPGQGFAILEFGSILVCPRTLVELESYVTLVRPHELSLISTLCHRRSGITPEAVLSAPTFSDIADKVYDILHGRIWAGHNILSSDCVRLREAYAQINRPPPEPKGTFDSLALLTQRFGRRAGNMKMASLADYFGLGKQTHRSLDEVRMNLEVFKNCATVLFLESSLPDIYTERTASDAFTEHPEFIDPNQVSIPSIIVVAEPFFRGPQRMQILHRNVPLQIRCDGMRVRFGLSKKFVDNAGRPRLSFVVDVSPNLCGVLDACDDVAKRFVDSDSNSEWRPTVSRKPGFYNAPTIRLHLPTVAEGNTVRWTTEIYPKDSSSVFSRYDVAEAEALFRPGSSVDAYFSLDPYVYQNNAGIRLVAKKLILR